MEHVSSTILIIDDHQDFQYILNELLSREGYQTLLASSAFEGMAMLEENAIDAILLDIMMPGRSGIEFLEDLRWHEKFSKIPVICTSAVSQTSEGLEFINAFSQGLVDKAQITEVIPLLKNLLENG